MEVSALRVSHLSAHWLQKHPRTFLGCLFDCQNDANSTEGVSGEWETLEGGGGEAFWQMSMCRLKHGSGFVYFDKKKQPFLDSLVLSQEILQDVWQKSDDCEFTFMVMDYVFALYGHHFLKIFFKPNPLP